MSQAVCAAAAAAWCSNSERPQQCFKKTCVVKQQGIAFDMQMLQDLKLLVVLGEELGAAPTGTRAAGLGEEGDAAQRSTSMDFLL